MAEKRMFSQKIVTSDAFLDMPMSARCLYFMLGMSADDDGFVGNPKSIMRQCGCSMEDLELLMENRFILGFESGVVAIKHWRINNTIRCDRYHATTYVKEMSSLIVNEKNAYTEKDKCLKKTANKKVLEMAIQAVEYLNLKTGRRFVANTEEVLLMVKSRMESGFTLDDFQKVIDNKCEEWLGDAKMSRYLRPQTLFSDKFDGYLTQESPKCYIDSVDDWVNEES